MTTRDAARAAASEAATAEAFVAQLEREAAEARAAAQDRAKAAEREAQDYQQQRERALAAERRSVREFKATADRALRADPPTGRPDPEVRMLARQYLHEGLDMDGLYRLTEREPRLGELVGLQRGAGQILGRLREWDDEALNAEVDALECRLWQAVVRRAQELAGEV